MADLLKTPAFASSASSFQAKSPQFQSLVYDQNACSEAHHQAKYLTSPPKVEVKLKSGIQFTQTSPHDPSASSNQDHFCGGALAKSSEN
jgi:hypothetical protein